MSTPPTPARPASLRRFVIGGAWFFMLVSLLQVGGALIAQAADPTGVTRLYHVMSEGHQYDVLGLTYVGWGGLLQAGLQFSMVAIAIAFSLLPHRPGIMQQARRAGHGTLIGWATLWTLSAFATVVAAPELETVARGGVLAALSLCVIIRAWHGWSPAIVANATPADTPEDFGFIPPEPEAVSTPDATPDGALTAAHVQSSTLTDVTPGWFARLRHRIAGLLSVGRTKVRDADVPAKARAVADVSREKASQAVRKSREVSAQVATRSRPVMRRLLDRASAATRLAGTWLRERGVIPTRSTPTSKA